MAATRQLSHVYPLGSRLNERGRLEVGGCDAIELAREFGTPAYVVAEDDLRARARAFVEAARARPRRPDRGPVRVQGLRLHRGLPGCWRRRASDATWRRAASSTSRCTAASTRSAIYLHGNAKGDDELALALERGVGHVVIDGLDEIERVERAAAARGVRQRVMLRVTPGIKPNTHAAISTGQLDTKFGLDLEQAAQAIERVGASDQLELAGLHKHIGSQIFELESFQAAIAALAALGDFGTSTSAAASASRTRGPTRPPTIESYVEAVSAAVREHLGAGKRLVLEPGRALTANSTVTLYSVESVKRNGSHLRRRRRRHVRQPAADALRRASTRRRSPTASAVGRCATSPASTASRATSSCATSSSTTRAPATCSSRPRPAPTATRWRTTTTASRARR